LNKIESMLQEMFSEEQKIESEEESELKTIRDSNLVLEYSSPDEWRKYIWEDCQYKEEKSEGSEIDFWCRKQKSPCRFEGCPLNHRD
ncbi:hypothetical protein KKB44_03525, partial [Candidatus Micrarchaeota archaeon]|nr:hypothetical protein [Candidatus Micrarchaeota archaeon]